MSLAQAYVRQGPDASGNFQAYGYPGVNRNCYVGGFGSTGALTAGVATVNATNVQANSIILFTMDTLGGTPGFPRVSAIVAGTSFTITSSSNTDTSTYDYVILNQLPQ